MQHAQALDMMRKKAEELYIQQRAAMIETGQEIEQWQDAQKKFLEMKQKDLEKAKKQLHLLESWPITERTRQNAEAEERFYNSKAVRDWKNKMWQLEDKTRHLKVYLAQVDRSIRLNQSAQKTATYESVKKRHQAFLEKQINKRDSLNATMEATQAELTQHKANEPVFKPVSKLPKRTAEITAAKEKIQGLQSEIETLVIRIAKEEVEKIDQYKKMQQDLQTTKETLDSLNDKHTEAIKKLSGTIKK